ncbi:Baculoviral IAP repeat-containing protein 3 [Cyphomyrmex costatus]|uniref:Baculoviral IAP repeat-containing protein 3 n=1 Tax=Cyphomyrmex costatus TaxID=456900 RepID=A0A195CZP1_9HYME|nr:Baculoviral IAP repeat-containing protein 3 [Cyphomyrmex costatus]
MSVYRYESERLISFIDWPYPCLWIEPTDFAAAGFYYTGTSDVVRCFECHIEVSQWNAAGGSPKNVHQRCAKTCRFVQNIQCGNVPIDTNPKAITIFVPEATLEIRLNNEDQAIIPLPIYPEYKSYVARLKSFANWPLTNIHNNIEKMAVAGLFYTGTYDVVMCYQCGGGLLAWEPNYDPLIEHIKFYRYCPYVCLIHMSVYRYESERLNSFAIDWPFPRLWIQPTDFAAAGFYYTGTSDVVRCFECHLEISQWNAAGDSPKNVHQRGAKTCRFVQNIQCGNVPIDTNPKAITIFVPEATLELCLNNEDRAEIPPSLYPEYRSYVARLKSFANWPLTKTHNIEKMAVSGLFYKGIKDKVICHQCGVRFEAWEPNDDPLIEHMIFFEDCSYMCLIHKSIPPPIKLFEEFQKLCEDVAKSFSNLTDLKVSVEDKNLCENIVKRFLNSNNLKVSVEYKSLCKICFGKDLEVLFLPCKHLIACEQCAQNVTECRVCRMVVERTLRVYIMQ